jgi:hypothetical protein
LPTAPRSFAVIAVAVTLPPLLLKYVQEQLGPHSPAFTLAVYGHLIPRGDRRAVDRLDDATERNPRATEWSESDPFARESEQIHPEVSELTLSIERLQSNLSATPY